MPRATNSNDALIIATGEIDTGVEGVFTLDLLTGELRGAVLNPARAKFVAKYAYPSVAKDFEAAKNPKFLMVTGIGEIRAESRRPRGSLRSVRGRGRRAAASWPTECPGIRRRPRPAGDTSARLVLLGQLQCPRCDRANH